MAAVSQADPIQVVDVQRPMKSRQAVLIALMLIGTLVRPSAQTSGQAQSSTVQDQVRSPLSLETAGTPLSVERPKPADAEKWRFRTDSSTVDLAQPQTYGVPNWHIGWRASRQVLGKLELGVIAGVSRGQQGPSCLPEELGGGKTIRLNTPITGPWSYDTIWQSGFTGSFPITTAGRLKIRAVGEIWNSFDGFGADYPLVKGRSNRTIRFGVVTTY